MKKTGKAKATQIKEFLNLEPDKQLRRLEFESSLHNEVFDFVETIQRAFLLKNGIQAIPKKKHDAINAFFNKAVNSLQQKLLDAYQKQNLLAHEKGVKFFYALADILKYGNQNPNFTAREIYVYHKCRGCDEWGEPLPSASQILRAWKISCGPNETAADVQIVEIQRDAKKVGYILPKQNKKKCGLATQPVKAPGANSRRLKI